jgi:predicted ATPase
MENGLITILEEIYSKVRSFEKTMDGTYESLEKLVAASGKLHYPTVAFLIYSRYVDLFNFELIEDEADIAISISQATHSNVDGILKVWNELKELSHHSMLLMELLRKYDLHSFQNEKNDMIIAEFINHKYLFGYDYSRHLEFEDDDDYEKIAYHIIDSCKQHIGIDMVGKLLVSVEHCTILENLLNHVKSDQKMIFCKCEKFSLEIRIAILFLDCYHDCQFVENETDELFPFEEARFDGLYYMRARDTSVLSLSKLLPYVMNNGFCVAFNQSRDRVDEVFFENEIPLMIDTLEKLVVVCKKVEDKDENVRYARFGLNDYTAEEADYWEEKLSTLIKNNGSDYESFLIMKKDDFRYATKEVGFDYIRRALDQMDFVWRNVADIITKPNSEQLVSNPYFDDQKIIRFGDLSNNPFKIKVDDWKYLSIIKEDKEDIQNKVVEECRITRSGSNFYNFSIPSKYKTVFVDTYRKFLSTEKTRTFDKMLTCRLVTKPSILYNNFNQLLRVSASKAHPVCIQKYNFHCEEWGWECRSAVDVIEISPDYDENFIIYQLIKGNDHKGHILVAPTKEEQHTYYINKRLEYVAQFQPAIDEMEDEVLNTIATSDSNISEIGLKNFRKFSNLNLLQLGGITILVGGNNSGKSTIVKGLLLAIDNIKSLVPQDVRMLDGGRQLYFQLDANNIHDTHIGTFNRVYSHNSQNSENGKREMFFSVKLSHFLIGLMISPKEKDDNTNVPIISITLDDKKRGISFSFDYAHGTTSVNFSTASESICRNYKLNPEVIFKHNMNVISSLVRGIADDIKNDTSDESGDSQSLKGKIGSLIEIAKELDYIITNTQVEYIYAHGINQKILYNYNDHNDYMAITLRDLKNEKLSNFEKSFIQEWMGNFGIGTDYDISSIGGEAYSIQIKNINGNMVHLADMGMGTNQVLILIFRLAIIIHRQRMRGNVPYKPTVIVEEPEQNMHPAFQSKLAMLFYEMHKTYGIKFIVETHSEYLVRRTQVIVGAERYDTEEDLNKKNVFKVYYFPTDKPPYEMKYRIDGNFINEFGKGFYDEASNLLFEIL